VATADAELAASQQQLEVAQANQQQYNALAGYSRIVAPFAGVITQRYADTGALIQAGHLRARNRCRGCGSRRHRSFD